MAEPEHRDEEEDDEDRRRFAEGLEVRGEVVPAGTDPVPPGVTHEIDEEDGEPHRRRYTAS